jgi:hypothetical protein
MMRKRNKKYKEVFMKTSMKRGIFAAFAATAMGLMAGDAHAATVRVIHGINGLDLNAARELPVDIAVNGQCALKGVKFAESTDVELAPGTYRVTVHPSNGSCSQKAVIDQQLKIEGDSSRGWSYSVIASLSEAGAPQLVSYFNNDAFGWARVVAVRHLAFAPPVFVKIDVKGAAQSTKKAKRIKNGDYGAAYGSWDTVIPYTITVATSRTGKPLATIKGTSRVTSSTWRIFHIVGSLRNGLEIVRHEAPPSIR